MPSISDLDSCANHHLVHYLDPAGPRAFATYDRLGHPDQLQPVDLFAPGLLDAPVRGDVVIAMYSPEGPYRQLRLAMEAVLTDAEARTARFEEQDLDADSGPWSLVRNVLATSDHTPGVKASKVTKILHRKRPHLIPIFDSRVARFYGESARKPWNLWPILQRELIDHGDRIRRLAQNYQTPDGRNISALRILDIVVWEHVTNCT